MGAGIGAPWSRRAQGDRGRRRVAARRRPARAAAVGLFDVHSVEAMMECCDLIVSVCPPSAALDVAQEVAGFARRHLSRRQCHRSRDGGGGGRELEGTGGRYVDGGIIGSPPSPTSSPRLYLSGPAAAAVRDIFAGTAVEAHVISEDQTAASAFKMCFAAWTKGTTALLLDVRALAVAEGVEGPLLAEWQLSLPDLAARSLLAAEQAATKGWRWVGEMDQIAARLPRPVCRTASTVRRRRSTLGPSRDEACRSGRGHARERALAPVEGTGGTEQPPCAGARQPISSLARPRTKRSAESARSVCT